MGKRTCTIEGCDKPHQARGYCSGHFQRWKRGIEPGATPLGTKTSREGTCTGPECSDPIIATGLCTGHYWQQSHGLPLTPKRAYAEKDGPCLAGNGCDRPRLSEGYCDGHYRRRLRSDPDWDRPIGAKAPHGAGHLDKQGYRIITVAGRPKREHVWLYEQHLGRPLLFALDEHGRRVTIENVHHKNGVRHDNRMSNLELWTKAQPAGQRVEDKVAFALEMLRLYAPEHLRGSAA